MMHHRLLQLLARNRRLHIAPRMRGAAVVVLALLIVGVSGQLPLWDPYVWGGQPLHGQVQPGAAYPLNWLLFSIPQRDGFLRYGVLDWYFVVLHILAASFAYLLARGLGASRMASILGGLIFSLGGYLGRADWPQMMNSALWTPLVLLSVFRAGFGSRPFTAAALGGLALGLAFLSGHHQVPIFLSIAAGLLWLALLLREGIFRPRIALAAGVFFAVAGLIAAVQILPSIEYGREAVRWIGLDQPASWQDPVPYQVHESFASHPHRLLGLVLPDIFDHYDHFVGFVGMLLVVLGVAASVQRWETRALLALGVLALLIAMGGFTPFHGILYALVPMVEKARNPAAVSALFSVAAAALAALGFDAIRRRELFAHWGTAAKVLVAIGAALFLLGFWLYKSSSGTFPTDDRFHIAALCCLLLAGLLAAWQRNLVSARWFSAALLVLLLVELSVSALLPFPSKYDAKRPGAYRKRFDFVEIADFVRQLPGFQRGQVDSNAIGIALGDLHQIPMFEGYTASVPTAIWDLGMSQRRVLELYGVRVWVGRQPLYDGQQVVREFPDGFKAWELEGVFPRAWIARQTVSFPSMASFRSQFDTGALADLRIAPFVGDAPDLPSCADADAPGGSVTIQDYRMNSVRLQASTPCGGLVILSDNAFPGWRAFVDGKEAAIHQPYSSLRGVVVQPGEHRIEMQYQPTSVWLGGLLSILGLLLAATVSILERRLPWLAESAMLDASPAETLGD
ncbi:MAG: YfhO family protein [Bryobacterales bacterium]|nr:YfhO family protein [Bryobacterales bacterium]